MAPALVLIHGYPFDHTLWERVAPQLTVDATVLTPDLPGFGGRPALAAEPSLDLMAEDIAAQMDSHNLNNAIIAGMSMGGYVALAFAEKFPNRLNGLALIATQALADADEARKGRREMIAKVRSAGPEVAATAAIQKLFSTANVNNEGLKRYPTQGAATAGIEGICWALEAMARRPDRSVLLEKLAVPSLVLHGTEDKFIPVERARQMALQLRDGEFVEVAGAGHALPIEAPEDCGAALRNLINRCK